MSMITVTVGGTETRINSDQITYCQPSNPSGTKIFLNGVSGSINADEEMSAIDAQVAAARDITLARNALSKHFYTEGDWQRRYDAMKKYLGDLVD